jgi:1,4-dihydroxy-2-naphthoate polyprenyltransferase
VVVAMWRPWAALALLGMLLALPPLRLVRSGAQGRALLPVLAATARLQLVVGTLLVVGILL